MSSLEFVAVEIESTPSSIIVYTAYMRTFNAHDAQKHCDIVADLCSSYASHRIFVIGDFNGHSVQWQRDESGVQFRPVNSTAQHSSHHQGFTEFVRRMFDMPLFQLVSFRNAANNVLDLAFTNDVQDVSVMEDNHTIIDKDQQDVFHVPFVLDVVTTPIGTPYQTRVIRCFKRGNYQRINQHLRCVNFGSIFSTRDVNSAYEFFRDFLLREMEENIPTRTVRTDAKRSPWWTRQLQQLKNKRNKEYKRRMCNEDQVAYRQAAAAYKSACDDRYNDYIRDTKLAL